MQLIYNSTSVRCKSPFGAIKCGQTCNFTIYVPKLYNCKKPSIIIEKHGNKPCVVFGTRLIEPQLNIDFENKNDAFCFSFVAQTAGVYMYYFDLNQDYNKIFKGEDGEAVVTQNQAEKWQLTVFEKNFETPNFAMQSVMYQIFPDRFHGVDVNETMPFADRIYRKNKLGEPYFWPTEDGGYLNKDYYGGNFKGIMQKLPYLKQLNVDIIYLNPIFEAHANHRYNTANYLKADPLLGTNDDFAQLCQKAKQLDMKIILDGVFSHTGSDSIYFNKEGRYAQNGAYNSENSPYRPWYDFNDMYECGYRSWWGFESLPEVKEHDESFRRFVCGKGGVIEHWLNLGASGFRLDVADELPDEFIEEIRQTIKRCGKDNLLIGEVWEDATNKISYGQRRTYLLGKGLDCTMNYPFKDAVLAFCRGESAKITAQKIMDICENYPAPALNCAMNFVSTHDTVRAITALAGEEVANHDRYWQSKRLLNHEQYEHGIKLLRIAYALIYTLPGVPCIYYGDEIAMQGYKDPFNRAYFNWGNKESRIVETLQMLGKIRKANSAFKEGKLTFIRKENGTLSYMRQDEQNTVGIAVNCNNFPVNVHLLGEDYVIEPFNFKIAADNNR